MLRHFTALLCLLTLIGCAEGNSIYHSRAISKKGDRVITLDAKQRNLLISRAGEGDWRMCAEAAPDVFSALSASASLDANVATKSGRVAAAIAEAAGTIERTQTVNLLRESMYRTCERYVDGSIGKSQLIVQAARDQAAMVKILAIEQLTRAARPPSTILVPPTTSASVVDGDTAASLIKDFAKQRADAKEALDKATADADTANTVGKCRGNDTPPADDAKDPTLKQWTDCKTAIANVAAKQAAFDSADDLLKKTLGVVGQLTSSADAATGTKDGQTGAGGGTVNDATLQKVADVVQAIANAPDIDEALMFCIAYLDPDRQDQTDGTKRPAAAEASRDRGANDQTANECRDIIDRRARLDNVVSAKRLADAGGNIITVFNRRDQASSDKTLFSYVTKPAGKTAAAQSERKRRIALAQSAAANLGLPHTPPDIQAFANTGDPATMILLLAELRKLETDPAGTADLSD